MQGDAVVLDVREKSRVSGSVHLPWFEVWDVARATPVSGIELGYHFARRGIGNGTTCLLLDDGEDWRAALVAYVLVSRGHREVAVVDGGVKAFLRAAADSAETFVAVASRSRGYAATFVGDETADSWVSELEPVPLHVVDEPAGASRPGRLAWRDLFRSEGRFHPAEIASSVLGAYAGPFRDRVLQVSSDGGFEWAVVWLVARALLDVSVRVSGLGGKPGSDERT